MKTIDLWFFFSVILMIVSFIIGRWVYERSTRIKNQLRMSFIFTNITHELLTPLTILSASVASLQKKYPEGQKEYDLMELNIQRSVRLLQQILETSKSQAGELKLLVSNGDVMQYIKETARSIRPLMDRKQLTFNIECKPESMLGWIDTDKLDKIIFNLLSNSVKYTPKGGRVTIEVNTNDRYDHIIIHITDTGVGIPPEKMKHLFTRFYDGEYRKNRTYGTGLGLALTRDLVYLHKGTIYCTSVVGEGTVFTIDLPIHKEAFSASQIDEKNQISFDIPEHAIADLPQVENIVEEVTETTDENASRILLVEDNKELLMLMKQLLHHHYIVQTASNGREALEIIQTNPFNLIVSDVMMPEMDGYELTTYIKQDANLKHLPIILITARVQEEDDRRALMAGADDYIHKPFKLSDLELRIDNIIANRQRIQPETVPLQTGEGIKEDTDNLSPVERDFLNQAIRCVEENMIDSDYDREAFAADMHISASTLYNKLRLLTGMNVSSFIRDTRIKAACKIAKEKPELRVSDIAYQVGFRDPKYFATSFKRVTGSQPKEYFDKLRGISGEQSA